MSSPTIGGLSASVSPNSEAGSSANLTPRFTADSICELPDVLRLWRSASPLATTLDGFERTPRSHPAAAPPRMHELIEAEIIPRLLLAHQQWAPRARGSQYRHGVLHTALIEAFSEQLVAADARDASRCLDALLAEGHDEHEILLELFTPAARLLGRRWELDTLSFSDVTIGLLRLHGMLRKLSTSKEIPGYPQRPDLRLLLSAYPGETHVFGIHMVAEFFRHAGWAVNDDLAQSARALSESVASEWFAVIGLSLSADVPAGDVAALVSRLRDASCNRHVGVMLGGDLCNRRPELASLVGADLTAHDAPTALAEAERWCDAVAVPYSMNAT